MTILLVFYMYGKQNNKKPLKITKTLKNKATKTKNRDVKNSLHFQIFEFFNAFK